MRAVILYHPKSEHESRVLDYRREFHNRHQDREIELLSLETKEGAGMAALYDIVRYPAILVIAENGSLQKLWQDENLPLMDELDYYFIQVPGSLSELVHHKNFS
jgi:hypothetical protein